MSKCHVPKCGSKIIPKRNKNEENTSVSFHRFPSNRDLRIRWLKFFGQKTTIDTKNYFVCSRHFSPDSFTNCYMGDLMSRRRLRAKAIPSIRYPQLKNKKKKAASTKGEVSYESFFEGIKPGSSLESSSCQPRAITTDGKNMYDSGLTESVIEPSAEELPSTAQVEQIPSSSYLKVDEHNKCGKAGSKSFDVLSSLWHEKVTALQEEVNRYKDESINKDGYIAMLESENRRLKEKLNEQQKVMADLRAIHRDQVISKAREMLSPKFTLNKINLMMGMKT